jgi:hypothetical protein
MLTTEGRTAEVTSFHDGLKHWPGVSPWRVN